MVIPDSENNGGYVALHPRMALTNIYKTHEEDIKTELKGKRLVIDKLSYEMSQVYEKGK